MTNSLSPNHSENNLDGVTIVIPAFNESQSIADVIHGIRQHISSVNLSFEILVVDDGSTDGTGKISENVGAKVLRLPYNRGYGAAIKSGIRIAKYGTILLMDGDGQHDSGDIPRLIDKMAQNDMVIGARESSKQGRTRTFGKFFLQLLVNYLIGIKVPDLNSGFRAFNKELALQFLHMFPNGFSLSTTSTMAFLSDGFRVEFIPINTLSRAGGKGKLRPVRAGVHTLALMLRLVMLFNPLKVFFPISGIIFMVGIGLIATNFSLGTYRIPASAIISISVSSLILCLALLAEQISILIKKRQG